MDSDDNDDLGGMGRFDAACLDFENVPLNTGTDRATATSSVNLLVTPVDMCLFLSRFAVSLLSLYVCPLRPPVMHCCVLLLLQTFPSD